MMLRLVRCLSRRPQSFRESGSGAAGVRLRRLGWCSLMMVRYRSFRGDLQRNDNSGEDIHNQSNQYDWFS
ncbi:hypothetical protein J6590_045134 [Homalodisca vitripennis]|nr:hypothetical protein J6590_045134 [Homalodisca vitripennis]